VKAEGSGSDCAGQNSSRRHAACPSFYFRQIRHEVHTSARKQYTAKILSRSCKGCRCGLPASPISRGCQKKLKNYPGRVAVNNYTRTGTHTYKDRRLYAINSAPPRKTLSLPLQNPVSSRDFLFSLLINIAAFRRKELSGGKKKLFMYSASTIPDKWSN
jgi:hypothetical protein